MLPVVLTPLIITNLVHHRGLTGGLTAGAEKG
jgi:hypothetical protein